MPPHEAPNNRPYCFSAHSSANHEAQEEPVRATRTGGVQSAPSCTPLYTRTPSAHIAEPIVTRLWGNREHRMVDAFEINEIDVSAPCDRRCLSNGLHMTKLLFLKVLSIATERWQIPAAARMRAPRGVKPRPLRPTPSTAFSRRPRADNDQSRAARKTPCDSHTQGSCCCANRPL